MDELTRNAIAAWWHRAIRRHSQQSYVNSGLGPPHIVCWCDGPYAEPTVWWV